MTQAIGFCMSSASWRGVNTTAAPYEIRQSGPHHLDVLGGTPHGLGSPDPALSDVAPYLSPVSGIAAGGLAISAGYVTGIGTQ